MTYLHRLKGQVAIQTIWYVASLAAAFAVPLIWGGRVDAANQVQDVKIENQAQQIQDLKTSISNANAKLDVLLLRQGIDPTKLTKGQ